MKGGKKIYLKRGEKAGSGGGGGENEFPIDTTNKNQKEKENYLLGISIRKETGIGRKGKKNARPMSSKGEKGEKAVY